MFGHNDCCCPPLGTVIHRIFQEVTAMPDITDLLFSNGNRLSADDCDVPQPMDRDPAHATNEFELVGSIRELLHPARLSVSFE
jgi:hypothetical protein